MDIPREWMEKDYYDVLGVSENASSKEITKQYRKLARQFHPDANPDDAKAEARFKDVSAAYDVIGDEDKREQYDEARRLGPMAGGFGGPGPGGAGGVPFDVGGMGGLGDIFGNLFGGGGRGGGQGPQVGHDLEAELHLSFLDAVQGVTTTVHLTSDAACETCKGTGSRPGTSPTRCATCAGRGAIDDNQGPFSFSRPCPDCGGAGSVITDPCGTCRGSGVERRPRAVKVRIPPGVDTGKKIRLKGKGTPGRNGGPAGDLYVRVIVDPHELFGRKGNHLTLTAPVTFSEAALGAEITVPTLLDGSVTLRIPAGTPSGKTFRVKGRGVHAGKTGDLLVTVEVQVPTELSDREREAVEALAAAGDGSPRRHLGVT
ncbi:MAG: molecular chaperone DnaJ [Acidimicrobiales bacterium]